VNPWEIPTGAVEVVAVRIGISAPVSARSEVVLLDTDRFRLCFSQIIFGTACVDGNTEAVRMSRKLPIPSPVKGEDLLESEELKQKLSDEAGVEMLLAVIAWKIDEKQKKFVKLQPEGIRCSRDGITTEP
jgi:hypothetical protein